MTGIAWVAVHPFGRATRLQVDPLIAETDRAGQRRTDGREIELRSTPETATQITLISPFKALI
jgi:hypothetical protein